MDINHSHISDDNKAFLWAKQELELELEKVRAEAKAIEFNLRALELDHILTLRRRVQKSHHQLSNHQQPTVEQTRPSATVPSPQHPVSNNHCNRNLLPSHTTVLQQEKIENTPPIELLDTSLNFKHSNQHVSRVKLDGGSPDAASAGGIPNEVQQASDQAQTQKQPQQQLDSDLTGPSPKVTSPDLPSVTDTRGTASPNPPATILKTISSNIGQGPANSPARYSIHRWFRSLPGWSVSVLLHLVVILLLALLVMPLPMDPKHIILTSESFVPESEPLDTVEFESEPFDETPDVDTDTIELNDLGLAGLGEIATVTDLSESGQIRLSPLRTATSDIGTFIGNDGEGVGNPGTAQEGAQFFEASAGGSRFAFVIDRSASMRAEGGYKWRAALDEVSASVARLKAGQSFFVIFYSGDPYPMFDMTNPERRPMLATQENREKLEKWLQAIQPHEKSARTKLEETLAYVLAMKPDATFILSDGKLTSTKLELFLEEANKPSFDPLVGEHRPSIIHTITFGKKADRGGLLQRIAETNGGSYSHYTPPKAPKPVQRGAS